MKSLLFQVFPRLPFAVWRRSQLSAARSSTLSRTHWSCRESRSQGRDLQQAMVTLLSFQSGHFRIVVGHIGVFFLDSLSDPFSRGNILKFQCNPSLKSVLAAKGWDKQMSRTESPKTDPHIHGQTIFNKDTKAIQLRNEKSLQCLVPGQLDIMEIFSKSPLSHTI